MLQEEFEDDHEQFLQDQNVRITKFEKWVAIANKIIMSRAYFAVYILIIFLSISTVIWTIVEPYPDIFVFWIIEFIVLSALIFEVAVRILAMGLRNYFSFWSNRIDFGVLLLCLGTVGFYIYDVDRVNNHGASLAEEVELALVILRNIAQSARIVVLIKNQSAVANARQVDFTQLRQDPHEDDDFYSGEDFTEDFEEEHENL